MADGAGLMRLIANGRVDPTPMTTHRFPFAEVEKAFQMMADKADGSSSR